MQYALFLIKYIILVQDFCPLKIKITQCPGGFCLKALYMSTLNDPHC